MLHNLQPPNLQMMKKSISFLTPFLVILVLLFTGCGNSKPETREAAIVPDTAKAMVMPKPLKEKVLTAEEQKALTPDQVIQKLKDGNRRYTNNDLTARDHSALVRDAAFGQYPSAVILSCIDSRVTVEDVFDKGIGDLFVCRVAGNFVNPDILGSMEYGCKVSGAKLIVVLGHQYCGAIKSAIDNVKLGNITQLLAKIKPAIEASADFKGEKTSKNDDYVSYVAANNVKQTIQAILKGSPLLKEMADKGEIKIIGAGYNLKTGEVVFY